MRSTEVADRRSPNGEFFGRDVGDRGRYRNRAEIEMLFVGDTTSDGNKLC